MTPVSRVEMYLAKICGEDVELPIPQTRKEVFLAIIAGESYEKPVPSSRVELYLAKILGDDVPLPIPQSREEIFLAAIAGVEYPLPYPESRIEYWLHKWATYEEWSTITGNPVSFTAKAAPLRQLQVAISPALYHLFYETTRGEVEVEVAATPQLIRSTEGDTDIVQTLLRFRFLSSDGICDVGSKAGISQSALNAPPVIKAIAEGEAEPDGLVVIHKFAAVDEIGRHERILIGLLVFITYVTVITSPFILRFRTWSILEFGDIIELRTT